MRELLTLVSAMAAEAKMSEEQFLTLSVGRDVVADREAALRVISARRAAEKAAAEKAAAEKKEAAAQKLAAAAAKRANRRAMRLAEQKESRATEAALEAARQIICLEEVAADAACLSELMGPDKFRASFGKVMRRLHGLKKAWHSNCDREVAMIGVFRSQKYLEELTDKLLKKRSQKVDDVKSTFRGLKGFAALAQLVGVRA